jgi:hypothetical protein
LAVMFKSSVTLFERCAQLTTARTSMRYSKILRALNFRFGTHTPFLEFPERCQEPASFVRPLAAAWTLSQNPTLNINVDFLRPAANVAVLPSSVRR